MKQKNEKNENFLKIQNSNKIKTKVSQEMNQYKFSILSPVYNDNPISPRNLTGNSYSKPYKINSLFLDSSIPMTYSKDFLNESNRKSINVRMFSAETPVDPMTAKRFMSRPQTSVLKKNTLQDFEDFEDLEELSQNSAKILASKLRKKKKGKKEAPFEMISQFTKLQNEDFLQKLRVLSAISRRTETLTFGFEDNFNSDKILQLFGKETTENQNNLDSFEATIPKTFDENDIYG